MAIGEVKERAGVERGQLGGGMRVAANLGERSPGKLKQAAKKAATTDKTKGKN